MEEIPIDPPATSSSPDFPPQIEPTRAEPVAVDEASITQLVNKILILGLREGANEIHLDPQENEVLVQIREKGNLRALTAPLPIDVIPAILHCLKMMANLDASQTQFPQKGRLRKIYNGRPVYFFVHTLPSFYGEKVLVRIVPSIESLPSFADIARGNQQQDLRGLIQSGSGLVVITGSACAGKSTTLEAFLKQQLQRNVTLGSVEAPIRHAHKRITQLEVDPINRQGFPQAIATLTEHSTDVIAVDTVIDAATAQALVEPLRQGRLVLITLTAKDAAAAIAQLHEWLPATILSEYLVGVVAQQLVRRVCPGCRLRRSLEPAEQQRYQLFRGEIFSANTLSEEILTHSPVKGKLCEQCGGVGYVGFSAVYETVPITPQLQSLLQRPCSPTDLRTALQQSGVSPLLHHALNLVNQGITTLEEVHRLFPSYPQQLPPLTNPNASASLPPEWFSQLAHLEQSLSRVTQAFSALKLAAASSLPVPLSPTPPDKGAQQPESKPENLDLLPELEALETLSTLKKHKKTHALKANKTPDSQEIEALLTEESLLEMDPQEPTLRAEALHPLMPDDQITDPFKSLGDPW